MSDDDDDHLMKAVMKKARIEIDLNAANHIMGIMALAESLGDMVSEADRRQCSIDEEEGLEMATEVGCSALNVPYNSLALARNLKRMITAAREATLEELRIQSILEDPPRKARIIDLD